MTLQFTALPVAGRQLPAWGAVEHPFKYTVSQTPADLYAASVSDTRYKNNRTPLGSHYVVLSHAFDACNEHARRHRGYARIA